MSQPIAPFEEARARGRAKAEAVLAALEPLDDHQLLIVSDAIGDRLIRAGSPVPPFTTIKAEADAWASFASLAELQTYLVAGFLALPRTDRTDFADWVRRKVTA